MPNPAHVLARILASFHDADGRVAVEGFYDQVADVPQSLRAMWAALGYDEAAFQRSAGGAPLQGEPGWSTPERLWIRPCLDVNGMLAGYTGPGKKTVLPAVASAKVSCRLVPDQDPKHITELLRRHVAAHAPTGVEVSVCGYQANLPWRATPDGPLFDAASAALNGVFGVEPVKVAHGGTLPIARDFADLITPSVAVMGFALPGANMHAPNEWIAVDQLEKGMRTMVRLYAELAEEELSPPRGGGPGGLFRVDRRPPAALGGLALLEEQQEGERRQKQEAAQQVDLLEGQDVGLHQDLSIDGA